GGRKVGNNLGGIGRSAEQGKLPLEHRGVHEESDDADAGELQEPRGGIVPARDHRGMLRECRRFISRRPRRTVARIRPQASARNARIIMPVESTAVGNRGTNPVAMNVTMTGAASTNEPPPRSSAKRPKNASGRSSLIRTMMVNRMRRP